MTKCFTSKTTDIILFDNDMNQITKIECDESNPVQIKYKKGDTWICYSQFTYGESNFKVKELSTTDDVKFILQTDVEKYDSKTYINHSLYYLHDDRILPFPCTAIKQRFDNFELAIDFIQKYSKSKSINTIINNVDSIFRTLYYDTQSIIIMWTTCIKAREGIFE